MRPDDAPQTGRVVILNGAPRSGKSLLARAIQAEVAGAWLNLGVDNQMASLPPHLMPGIGLRPGGERPDLEPDVVRLYQLLFDTIRLSAQAGFDIIADLGMHEDYSAPLGIFERARQTVGPLRPLLVGVDCPIEEIMRRRNAAPNPALVHYLGGETPPPPVKRWQEAVHAGKRYDLRLDMGTLSPADGAAQVARLLAFPPSIPVMSIGLKL